MIKIKLERGDQIEHQEADWIRTHISPYEEIWGRYIGNDGSNNALELVSGCSEFISHRDKFNQCHYSILISLLILRRESERYRENLGIATTPQSYLDVVRDLTGFMAQVGRLRDLFEAISNCLGMGKSVWERFDDFYKSRSAVIHGSVVPMKVEEGFVWVPNFETSQQQNAVWSSKAVWLDCSSTRHNMLSDYMQETFSSLCQLAYSSLSEILTRLKQMMPDASLHIKMLSSENECYPGPNQIMAGSAMITLPPGSGIS